MEVKLVYMNSSFDMISYDWLRRFFPSTDNTRIRLERIRDRNFDDFYREFYEMRRDIERTFSELLIDLEIKFPQDLFKEYEISEDRQFREIKHIFYGYSRNICSDGTRRIREFGNVKSPKRQVFSEPAISTEREPLIDISSTDNEIKIVAEMPRISKEKIKIDAYDKYVEIKSEDPDRKYHKQIEVPNYIDVESGKSTYKNGILEITFKKREQIKRKGRKINIQ